MNQNTPQGSADETTGKGTPVESKSDYMHCIWKPFHMGHSFSYPASTEY